MRARGAARVQRRSSALGQAGARRASSRLVDFGVRELALPDTTEVGTPQVLDVARQRAREGEGVVQRLRLAGAVDRRLRFERRRPLARGAVGVGGRFGLLHAVAFEGRLDWRLTSKGERG